MMLHFCDHQIFVFARHFCDHTIVSISKYVYNYRLLYNKQAKLYNNLEYKQNNYNDCSEYVLLCEMFTSVYSIKTNSVLSIDL